jgi:DNA-directed RNA polymerase subunit RPC12/RpoP
MPLISCPDCGNTHSDTAPACIHCGRPNAPAQDRTPVPVGMPTYPMRCLRCRTKITHSNVWNGGPVDCPQCGAKYEAMERRDIPPDPSQGDFRPGVAALLSFLIPGAGQMYRGKVGIGLLWFFGVVLGYILMVVPGVILHLLCVFNAASR